MRISPFQAMFPKSNVITSNDSFFGQVKEKFPEYRESGFFIKQTQASFFIYQIEGKVRTYTGIVACADLEEYLNGKIKKHENTLVHKEKSQLELLMLRKANIKPVLLTYHPDAAINQFINDFLNNKKPTHSFHFEAEQATHQFFEINEADQVEKLVNLFAEKIDTTYIADGHHRCSTNAIYYEQMKNENKGADYRNLLCAFFPSNELKIYDFNRVVSYGGTDPSEKFLETLSAVVEIEKLDHTRKPKTKYEITLLINEDCFSLKWKKEILDLYKNQKVILDAALLTKHILQPIFGIEDVKTDTRIKYIEGAKPMQDLVIKTNKGNRRCAFCIYPVKMEELLLVADEDKIMPPKSTWFEPRMKNGLISQGLEGMKG